MESNFLGFLGSGEMVCDRVDSHLNVHQEVLSVLPNALLKIQSGGLDFIKAEIDMGEIVGETQCVATNDCDVIVFAKRPGRFGLTRFVKNRKPSPCEVVAIILKKAEVEYILITAFIGALAPPEPWDKRAFGFSTNPKLAEAEAHEFWATHALVWGTQETISGTETEKSPY